MNLRWSSHAVQRCWERMQLGHHEKDMDRFDAAIKKNIKNMISNSYGDSIPFKVNGDCYLAIIKKFHQTLMIKTIIPIKKKTFNAILKGPDDQWVG